MTRPLLLGEAPSRSGDQYWRFPLSGAVGKRLAEWSDLTPEPGGTQYGRWYWPLCEVFEPRNLLERWPGAQGRGAAFPLELAGPAWDGLLPTLQGRVVVLLGARLRALVGLPREFGVWAPGVSEHRSKMCADEVLTPEGIAVTIAAIPHPSGLNSAYDDPANARLARRVLREARDRAAG
jgi:uracil-DNA glycosylase